MDIEINRAQGNEITMRALERIKRDDVPEGTARGLAQGPLL